MTKPSAKASTASLRMRLATWHRGLAWTRASQSLLAFIDAGFAALHHVVEYWDGGSLKVSRHRR